jgi:hypothetical protein
MFTADWEEPERVQAPTLAEARAFVGAHEQARGRPFSVTERRTIAATFAYACAHSARCAHALAPDAAHEPGAFALGQCRSVAADGLPAGRTRAGRFRAEVNAPRGGAEAIVRVLERSAHVRSVTHVARAPSPHPGVVPRLPRRPRRLHDNLVVRVRGMLALHPEDVLVRTCRASNLVRGARTHDQVHRGLALRRPLDARGVPVAVGLSPRGGHATLLGCLP